MTITQEQLDSLEQRLQQTIDEKVGELRTELISEARSIIEQYQANDRTASRLQDALDRIRQEVLRTVRSAVAAQISSIRSQQERDIAQLTSAVTSTVTERLRAFKSEVAEYTSTDRNGSKDSTVAALEHQVKISLQQLESTNTSFRQQMTALVGTIKKEKSEMITKSSEAASIQQQIEEEERKIRHLQAEIASRERHLSEERAFLQAQREAFAKEKRMAERAKAQSRRLGEDKNIEKAILKELQAIRKNLGSSVINDAYSVVTQLKKNVDVLSNERERMRSTREMLMRAMGTSDYSYSRYPQASRMQPSMF